MEKCKYYGDCPFNTWGCPEDDPLEKCEHRETDPCIGCNESPADCIGPDECKIIHPQRADKPHRATDLLITKR